MKKLLILFFMLFATGNLEARVIYSDFNSTPVKVFLDTETYSISEIRGEIDDLLDKHFGQSKPYEFFWINVYIDDELYATGECRTGTYHHEINIRKIK